MLLAVLMFAVSNAVYAYTAHFSVMLAFRIIPALCHPVFFSVALAAAARLVPAGQSGKAVTKVFSGITAGFAFGVPFTSYLAERLSLESAFLFGAIVSIIAFTGILLFLPSMPVTEKMSFRSQLGILRKPALWLNITAVICLFAAMFSVYSYFAEYLGRVSHMNGTWVSFMLMTFGVIMIAGNFVFGALLYKNMKKTVIAFPLLYTAAYLLIYGFGTSFAPMAVLVFVWGAVHSGGLIVSQTWLTAEAKEAPEFGNSLFVSFFQPRHHHRNRGRRLVYFTSGDSSADVVRHHVLPSGFRADHGALGMGKEAARRSLNSVAKSGMFTYNMPDYDKGEKKIHGKTGRILDSVSGLCH